MHFAFQHQKGIIPKFEDRSLHSNTWKTLARQLEHEQNVTSTLAHRLEERWWKGETAIVSFEGEIISHLSCLAAIEKGLLKMGDDEVGYFPALKDALSIRLLSTGWTHPNFRRQGLSRILRTIIFQNFAQSNSLVIGVSNRILLPTLEKEFACYCVPPGKIPFIQALSWLSTRLKYELKSQTAVDQKFWVSNWALAQALNLKIPELTGFQLDSWRTLLQVETNWSE